MAAWMQKLAWAMVIVGVFFLSACGWHHHCRGCKCSGPCAIKQGAAPAKSDRSDVLYTCSCGAACPCKGVSVTPGNCGCGKPMKWQHVIRTEGQEAIVCGCAEGCTCKIDPKDPTKCGCGKAVERINLKNSGIYFCNCGGSCACNTLAAAPADCGCGMPLKKAD